MGKRSIGIVGGTGAQGKGLGYRFALAGHSVTVGSRSEERAAATADEINNRTPETAALVRGASNEKAAEMSEIVLLTVPWDGHRDLVTSLREHVSGKLVISCVNPLGFDQHGPYGLSVAEGSAAEQAAYLLPESKLVGAFHHVSAASLWSEAEALDHEDVLVCGDDQDAKRQVEELACAVTGRCGIDAGALRLARQLEPLTAVLISINKRYKVKSGIAVAGFPEGIGSD